MTPAEGSREIQHPLMAKVFPGVQFVVEAYNTFNGMQHKVIALYEEQRWGITDGFNLLFAQVADHSTGTDAEIVEAFVRLHFWIRERDLEITRHETEEIEIITKEGSHWLFNHRLVFRIHWKGKSSPPGELLVLFKDQQIISAYVTYRDGKNGYIISPMGIKPAHDSQPSRPDSNRPRRPQKHRLSPKNSLDRGHFF
jgi:hypothetical protein